MAFEEHENWKHGESLANAWQEGMQIREIMLFLHSHGVSTGRAVRIFKTYGRSGHPDRAGEPVHPGEGDTAFRTAASSASIIVRLE